MVSNFGLETTQRRRTRSTTAMGLGLGQGMGMGKDDSAAEATIAVATRLAVKPINSIECSEKSIIEDDDESGGFDDDRTETLLSKEEIEEDVDEDSGSEFIVRAPRTSRCRNAVEEESKDERNNLNVSKLAVD